MANDSGIMAVAFGVDEVALKLIKAALTRVEFRELPLEISAMLKPQLDFEPDLIFCGLQDDKIEVIEIAQGIRSMYATAPIYYATSNRVGFDRKKLTKCGFTDAFLMPMDQAIIRDLIADGSSDFKNVPLVDIKPETVLDFDTYILLPMNRKYVRFSSAGHTLEASRVKRLIDHQVGSVYVARHEIKQFYDFTAQQLKSLTDSGEPAVSETERRERMHAAVRSLLTGFLTDTSELQDCAQIVHSYVLNGEKDTASLFEKILRLGGNGGDGYTHVSNASTLGALFAMALLPESVESVALAGLLHDIGMADVPIDVQMKSAAERTPEERALYERHPAHSIALLKARNIQIPETVLKIIEQHHERFDGSGFPAKIAAGELLKETQLLAIADEFDYLTTVTLGKTRCPPQEAIQVLLNSSGYDPELLASISELF